MGVPTPPPPSAIGAPLASPLLLSPRRDGADGGDGDSDAVSSCGSQGDGVATEACDEQ